MKEEIDENVVKIFKENSENKFILDRKITIHEVKKAIKKLSNKKSPGIDKITNKMLKFFNDEVALIITDIFNK